MCTDNLRKILSDVTKGMEKPDLISISGKIVDAYYRGIYVGSEHDFISLIYMRSVHLELLFWLGKNYHKIKRDGDVGKLSNFFTRHVTESRISCYSRRENYFNLWINGAGKCNIKSDFMCYLFSVYPVVNDESIEEVKKELDIVKSLKELEKKLEGLL